MVDALRAIKQRQVDASQYVTALDYADLDTLACCDLSADDGKRPTHLHRALLLVLEQRAVPDALMRRALTADEYEAYVESFDTEISHAESSPESDDMPVELADYAARVQQGDKYTRLAHMHRRSRKYDANGKTASMRFRDAAFACYEAALLDLVSILDTNPERNPQPDHALAARVQQWLDRDVDVEPGHTPDPDIEDVPRIRGSKSKYTRQDAPLVGVRKRRYWRDRIAITEAALSLTGSTQ